MNRNAIIFVLASVGVLLLWNRLVDHYAPTPPAASATLAGGAVQPGSSSPAVSTASGAASGGAGQAATVPSMHASSEQRVKVETGVFQVELSNLGAQFSSLKLKGTRSMQAGGDGMLDLVPDTDAPRHGVLELAGTNLDS
ncbi:MAG TPA: hypothetical protein VK914_08135, partial [bacterium]|nr:hypothetical protein [bacterium]